MIGETHNNHVPRLGGDRNQETNALVTIYSRAIERYEQAKDSDISRELRVFQEREGGKCDIGNSTKQAKEKHEHEKEKKA